MTGGCTRQVVRSFARDASKIAVSRHRDPSPSGDVGRKARMDDGDCGDGSSCVRRRPRRLDMDGRPVTRPCRRAIDAPDIPVAVGGKEADARLCAIAARMINQAVESISMPIRPSRCRLHVYPKVPRSECSTRRFHGYDRVCSARQRASFSASWFPEPRRQPPRRGAPDAADDRTLPLSRTARLARSYAARAPE